MTLLKLGHPKPPLREPKAPKRLARQSTPKRTAWIRRNTKPLQRSGPVARSKRPRRCIYDHPQVKAQSRAALRRDRHRCRLQHPGCLIRATQTHHLRYSPGRGWRRLILDDLKWLISVCFNCHKVEDPHLGNGRLGKGSRKANGLPEQPAVPSTDFVEIP